MGHVRVRPQSCTVTPRKPTLITYPRPAQVDEKATKDANRQTWTVDCVTLPEFIAAVGADPSNLVRAVGAVGFAGGHALRFAELACRFILPFVHSPSFPV